MVLVGIFLINAALSFALSIVLASLLGPDGFGRYAVGLSVCLVVNTVLFEWLRLSTTRFYSERVRSERGGIRRTLDRAYWIVSACLVVATAAWVWLAPDPGLPTPLLGAAVACGLAYGSCEYRMALSRARFLQRPYAALGLMRAAGGFVLAAGAAWLTGDPALVLAGAALAALLPILVVGRSLGDPASAGAAPDGALLRAFARYALPLVAASALYQLIPFLNRTLLAGREGFTEAGYFSLASELATRLFQNLGAAMDLLLFQLAVRAEEHGGPEAGERQVARNLAVIGAVVIPSAAGLWLVWPTFEQVFVPELFRGRLAGTILFTVPALAVFALVQYGLNAVFQLRRRTAPVIAAAAVAIAVDVGVVFGWPVDRMGPEGYAAAQFAGMAGGIVTLCAVAVASGARLPWRDLGLSALAAAIMAGALWTTRGWPVRPLVLLVGQVGAGAAIYATLALAFDIAGVRGFWSGWRGGLAPQSVRGS